MAGHLIYAPEASRGDIYIWLIECAVTAIPRPLYHRNPSVHYFTLVRKKGSVPFPDAWTGQRPHPGTAMVARAISSQHSVQVACCGTSPLDR